MMRKGLLILFSGPSGVGKGTIMKEVMADERLKICFSVSMTTRAPRVGEVEGVNYFFVTRAEFEQAVAAGEMLEHAEFVGNYYGTPKKYVENKRNEGLNVVLEIDVQGALQVMKVCPDALSIFVAPPSVEELANRLRKRGTESEEVIAGRIAQANYELSMADHYHYRVINDDLGKAIKEVKELILKAMEEV